MAYRDLRKLFHDSAANEAEVYEQRYNDPHTLHLDLLVSGNPAFVYMAPELYDLALAAEKLDKDILKLELMLPRKAISSYTEARLVDEIVLTNEIEGVYSTQREISEVLERLKANDKHGRFNGILQKYLLLSQHTSIALSSPEDIRLLYNEIVLDDILADNLGNAPDGKLFRRNVVHVVDESGIAIHDGVEPEEKIIEYLEQAIVFLNNESIPLLIRISVFHFLFGYIHPFYDGNGRTNRFISSYMITKSFEPVVGLGLSFAVKTNIKKYYKAYKVCEHSLNKGDITPFALAFSEIVVSAMQEMKNSLAERVQRFEPCVQRIKEMLPGESADIGEALVTATLFSLNGLEVADLCKELNLSRQTVYKRFEPLKQAGVLMQQKLGRKTFYKLNLDRL